MAQIARILFALLVLAAPVPAAAGSLTLNRVKSLLSEMGFKPKRENDVRITLESMGTHKKDVVFTLSADDTALTIYTAWSIPADKQDQIPAVRMLKANNGYPFTFSVYGEPGDRSFDLEKNFDGALVSKVMLRKSIDQILEAIDNNEEIWETDNWPIKDSK